MEKISRQEKLAKQVGEYFKVMQKKLKEWHGKDIKSPLQLEKGKRKEFFRKLDKFRKDDTKEAPKKEEKKEEKKSKKTKKALAPVESPKEDPKFKELLNKTFLDLYNLRKLSKDLPREDVYKAEKAINEAIKIISREFPPEKK